MSKPASYSQYAARRLKNPKRVTRRIAIAVAVVVTVVLTAIVANNPPTEAATSAPAVSAADPATDVVGSMSLAPSGCVLYRVITQSTTESATGKYVMGNKSRAYELPPMGNLSSVMCGKPGMKAKLKVQTGVDAANEPIFKKLDRRIVVPDKAYGFEGRMRVKKSNCDVVLNALNPDEKTRKVEIWASTPQHSPSSAIFSAIVPSHDTAKAVFNSSSLESGMLLTLKVNMDDGPLLLDYKMTPADGC